MNDIPKIQWLMLAIIVVPQFRSLPPQAEIQWTKSASYPYPGTRIRTIRQKVD